MGVCLNDFDREIVKTCTLTFFRATAFLEDCWKDPCGSLELIFNYFREIDFFLNSLLRVISNWRDVNFISSIIFKLKYVGK